MMADVPGILAVIMADRDAIPRWSSPSQALTLPDLYQLTGDPKIKRADRNITDQFATGINRTLNDPRIWSGLPRHHPDPDGAAA